MNDAILSFSIPDSAIRIEMEIDPISFETDRAIYLGLILNELLTNTIKYAFTEEQERTFVSNYASNSDLMVV